MIGLLGAALMAGLVGSPHCIGMCGGFAVLCGRKVADSTAWHAGRLTTYALLGALAGTLGSMVPGPSWVAAIVSLGLMIWFSAALAGLMPEPRIVIPGLQRLGTAMAGKAGLSTRYTFGVVNGFLPCGLVYAALSLSVASTHPGWGALAMVAFGIGTVPVLSAVTLGVQRIMARDIRVRRAIAAGVLVAGLWSIGMRQGILGSQTGHGMHEHQMQQPRQLPALNVDTHDGT